MVCRVAVLAGLLAASPAFAQVATPTTAPQPKLTFAQIGVYIYPAKGQSPTQQKKDEDACYGWAEKKTGLTLVAGNVDIEAAAKASAQGAGKGKVGRGAAGGAASGLAIGAITGNAGRGVAVGALVGSARGLRGRVNAQKAAGRAGAQQAVQANQQAVDQFKKAAGACLEGRGYSVK
jgi:hypothetical protein